MSAVENFFQSLFYSIPSITITDILDILVVAFLVYKLLRLLQSTNAARALRSILALLVFTWVTELLHMYALHWILSRILEVGLIALVIVFQPELRRALERIGSRTSLQVFGKPLAVSAEAAAISATVAACEVMSRQKIGVLLAFERNVSLEEYFKTGTIVDARVSEQLLRNLFFPKAALHDGAAIIRGGRVAAAGCVMPLSENTHLSADLGTRHRAGVGTSEASDAVVVIVSEETGTISVAIGGMLQRHLAPQTLEKLLQNELLPKEDGRDRNLLTRLKNELSRRAGRHEGQ